MTTAPLNATALTAAFALNHFANGTYSASPSVAFYPVEPGPWAPPADRGVDAFTHDGRKNKTPNQRKRLAERRDARQSRTERASVMPPSHVPSPLAPSTPSRVSKTIPEAALQACNRAWMDFSGHGLTRVDRKILLSLVASCDTKAIHPLTCLAPVLESVARRAPHLPIFDPVADPAGEPGMFAHVEAFILGRQITPPVPLLPYDVTSVLVGTRPGAIIDLKEIRRSEDELRRLVEAFNNDARADLELLQVEVKSGYLDTYRDACLLLDTVQATRLLDALDGGTAGNLPTRIRALSYRNTEIFQGRLLGISVENAETYADFQLRQKREKRGLIALAALFSGKIEKIDNIQKHFDKDESSWDDQPCFPWVAGSSTEGYSIGRPNDHPEGALVRRCWDSPPCPELAGHRLLENVINAKAQARVLMRERR